MILDGKRLATSLLTKVGGLHMPSTLVELGKSDHMNTSTGEARSRLG